MNNYLWKVVCSNRKINNLIGLIYLHQRFKSTKSPENYLKLETGTTYSREDSDYKVSRKNALENLKNIFNIRTFFANRLLLENENLARVNKVFLTNIFELYTKYGVKKETLYNYPKLLTVTNIERKIQILEMHPADINENIILALINTDKLERFITDELFSADRKDKIPLLCKMLMIDKHAVCEILVEKQFLIAIRNKQLKERLATLKKFGVKPTDICNDLWVLKYSIKMIEERLELAKSSNIDKVKTWMVRATSEILQHYIERRSVNKFILGDSSLAEYLSERLDCNLATANSIIQKQPVLKNKSLKKLKNQIDCLLSAGFQPAQICRVPKILVHSVETTTNRLKKLDDKGLKLDSLSILTKSQKEFNLQYEVLLKNKHKSFI